MAQYKKLSDYTVNTSPNDGDLVPLLVDNGNGTYDNALMEYSSLKGENGMGVPSGGIGNQVLTKNSGADYDTIWSTISKSSLGLGSVTNDLQLKAASNLSDLPDKAASRTNLGLGSLALKSTIDLSSDTTGVLPEAQGGAGAVNGILKANGSGTVSKAVLGTDYGQPPVVYQIINEAVLNGSTLSWQNETSDTSGFWTDVGNTTITFTTTGTTRIKITGFGQGRNTVAGNNPCFLRVLLDGTQVGARSRTDSPNANGINTHSNGGWVENVPAGTHTVKMQVTRSERADGSGTGTATVRGQQVMVEVYQIAA